jgi:2-oxoglutarate ferredoxin oxidoreductase subunit delta
LDRFYGTLCRYAEGARFCINEKTEEEAAGKMIIRLNREFCKGCGLCIEFCPKKVYELSDELNSKGYQLPKVVNLDDCSECGQCDLYCPEFAIVLENTPKSKK